MNFKETETLMLVLEDAYAKMGVSKYIGWDYTRYPHVLVFGGTGSGKTYFVKLLLARIGMHINDAEVLVCDFKGDDDFAFLKGNPHFYRFDQCSAGLDYANQKLKARQSGKDPSRTFVLLLFDEWAAFLNSLEKKAAEEAKRQLGILLMLGRSFGVHILISVQRADASYFNTARDNFSVIVGMGKLSRESVDMLFFDFKDQIDRNKPRGKGTLLLGNRLYDIVVPTVQNPAALERAIVKAVGGGHEDKGGGAEPRAAPV